MIMTEKQPQQPVNRADLCQVFVQSDNIFLLNLSANLDLLRFDIEQNTVLLNFLKSARFVKL